MSPVSRRLLTIIVVVIVAVGSVLAFEAWLSLRTSSSFAHTRQGHLMGWAGLGVILLVFVYPIKKRVRPNVPWPRGWFQVHMTAGVIGPLLIVLHSGAHVHALVPQLALAALAVVVVSGVVGQGVHYLAVRALNDRRRQLHDEGVAPDDIDVRLQEMAVQEEGFRLWQAVHSPMTIMFLVLTAMHVARALYFGGM